MKIVFFTFFFILSIGAYSQDVSNEVLSEMSDDELLNLFNKPFKDSIKGEKVIRFYLNKARKEKDILKIVKAYRLLISISESDDRLSFSDSIIQLTNGFKNKNYPAVGYILKGLEYYSKGNLKLATKNYFEAYSQALKKGNITQQIFISDKFIALKSFWGNQKEALVLQKKRHKLVSKDEYIKEVEESARVREGVGFESLYNESQLTSIQNFVVCYINLKVLDSASIYVDKGLEKISEYNGYNKKYFQNWFILASIEINSRLNENEKAINESNELLASIDVESNLEIAMDLYFFKGFALIDSDKYEEGIEYLNKADSIFTLKNIALLPYHRDLFEELLKYHNSKDDTEMKIKYLNKLIMVDSVFKVNYQYFEPNLIKNYETPKLLKEKEVLIAELKKKNEKSLAENWWLIVFLGTSIVAFAFYIMRQMVYKKRFENLMQLSKSTNENSQKHEISPEIIAEILSHLKVFEDEKKYLSQKISLQSLARSFGTNHTYLSKVINLNMDKNFTAYIHDLRIEYIFQELKDNEKLRKYTIKAIAVECGFTNAESFSKAFYKKYEIYPSYYIKQLEKSNA